MIHSNLKKKLWSNNIVKKLTALLKNQKMSAIVRITFCHTLWREINHLNLVWQWCFATQTYVKLQDASVNSDYTIYEEDTLTGYNTCSKDLEKCNIKMSLYRINTCAKDLDGMNSSMPSSCPVANTLYGVKCRSRFSNWSNLSIRDTIWITYRNHNHCIIKLLQS